VVSGQPPAPLPARRSSRPEGRGLWPGGWSVDKKMVFGTIFQRILDEVKEETEKKEKSLYWVRCPACGRRVVKKELIKKGCYICGWQPEERIRN